ncbi:DOMON-like domain-containing protein [Sphingomonas sp. 22176]|uniref:DOMON-like domain-containing protein n=1 Tax=Sphingomonas sp. 22176 TaxID=3453884 RepID=UPI003F82BCF8
MIRTVHCRLQRDAAALHLLYSVAGAPGALLLPSPATPARTGGLWKTTCLELFVADAGGAYREFNFAPSGQWAAYGFTARRQDMAPLAMPVPPTIQLTEAGDMTCISVHLPNIGIDALRLGITAVIEEKDGTKSYWALRHGGDAPDFHDPDCFVVQLPPAD